MIRLIAVFLLGVIAGAVGIMVVSCLWVERMDKRELTKEEWKAGMRPNQEVDSSLWLVAYIVAATAVFTLMIGVMCYR